MNDKYEEIVEKRAEEGDAFREMSEAADENVRLVCLVFRHDD